MDSSEDIEPRRSRPLGRMDGVLGGSTVGERDEERDDENGGTGRLDRKGVFQ